jgi:hypothetical protein
VPKSASIKFIVNPASAPGLKISVNGSQVSGSSFPLTLGGKPKKVRVVAKARGYRTWRRAYTIRRNQTIRISLKRPKPTSSPGGLIDL